MRPTVSPRDLCVTNPMTRRGDAILARRVSVRLMRRTRSYNIRPLDVREVGVVARGRVNHFERLSRWLGAGRAAPKDFARHARSVHMISRAMPDGRSGGAMVSASS
jgi:hypothetical protein